MWSQPRELQPNDISLFESLGVALFEALFCLNLTKLSRILV